MARKASGGMGQGGLPGGGEAAGGSDIGAVSSEVT